SKADSTWIWYFGDGQTSTVREPTHTYASRGTYNVMLVAYNSTSGCRDSMTLPVNVGDNPPIITASRTTLCKGQTVAFNSSLTYASNVVYNYYWYINDIPVNLFPSFTHKFDHPGQYTVKLVIETF